MEKNKSLKELDLILEFLDEEIPDKNEGIESARRLGIDVRSMATGIREKIAERKSAERQQRFEQARVGMRMDLKQLMQLPPEPRRLRREQESILRSLVASAPQSISVNFQKFERATDEELAEMISHLRYLIESGNGSKQ